MRLPEGGASLWINRFMLSRLRTAIQRYGRSARGDPAKITALGGLLVLVVPPLIFGPWLPFIDLVSFVGMNTYPPVLSYGPLHFYTFQFTYEGHYVLSRLMSDLHISAGPQIVAFYLAQVLVAFCVLWRTLEKLVANPWLRAVAISFGTLVFWDGVFLWGGPLAYSLAAMALSIATFLTFREATEPTRNACWLLTVCVLFAMFCHPFAAPFALIVAALRFIWVKRFRVHTLALVAIVGLYSVIILRDSPQSEASASGQLGLLFGFDATQMWLRIRGLFTLDEVFARALFGTVPWQESLLFIAYASVRAFGFVLSPIVALRERNSLWIRMLATLNSIVAVLYLFSWDVANSPIPEWPQRILTLYAPFTLLAGIAALVFLFRRPADQTAQNGVAAPRVIWALPIALLGFMLSVEVPVLRKAKELEANYRSLRDGTLESGLKECFALVAGVDSIQPFYLRCVPFLLFSDPQIVSRHVLIATEWHFQARHPSKVLETLIDVDRKRYLAKFSCPEPYNLHLEFQEQSNVHFPVLENTNVARWGNVANLASDQFQKGMDLLKEGIYNSALEHFNTALYLQPSNAHAWNDGGAALFRAQRFRDAVDYFRRAVAADPKLLEARLNLAKALVNADQRGDAIPVLEEYLRLDPDNHEATELAKQLKTALPTKP